MVLADVFEVYYSNVYYSKVGGVKVRSFIDLFMTSRTVSEIQSGEYMSIISSSCEQYTTCVVLELFR